MIVLADILNKRESSSEWNITDGIKWKLVRASNHKCQIFIICPKCGKIGTLWRVGSLFYVIHDRNRRKRCRFGWCTEGYDTLKKIYVTGVRSCTRIRKEEGLSIR